MRKVALVAVLICLYLSLLFTISFSQTLLPAAASSTYRGDLDENGKVDIFDLLALLRVLSGQQQTEHHRQISDLDKNSKIDIFDLLGLLKVLGGQEPEVIYWGPAIVNLSRTSAAIGDTLDITLENIGESITAADIQVYIGEDETNILEFSLDNIRIVVPDNFTGGEVKVIVASDTTNQIYCSYQVRQVIAASVGGVVEHDNLGANVSIPANALQQDVAISITEIVREIADTLGILEDTSEVIVEFGPAGTVFEQSVTMGLPMPDGINDADSLLVVYYDEEFNGWMTIAQTGEDTEERTVYVAVSHFSIYKVRKKSSTYEALLFPDRGAAGGPIYLEMARIPGGTFQMGQEGVYTPVHQVTVSAFQMSRHEITNAQYAEYLNVAFADGEITATSYSVTGASGDYSGQQYINLSGNSSSNSISFSNDTFTIESGKENWPVIYVTWYGAKAFALKNGLDLPTEAQWEYAARGGQQHEYGTDDGTISSAKANYNQPYVGFTKDVGSYPPNPFGLYDMSGNVYEWCNDWYSSYNSEHATDPQGPSSGSSHVHRGGGWDSNALYCHTASRGDYWPGETWSDLGFRVVRGVEE